MTSSLWSKTCDTQSRTFAVSLPAFAIAVVLTLALGIGANVAIFIVVCGVLLRPLPPFAHPEQLVRIFDDLAGTEHAGCGQLSAPELWDLEDRSGVFQEVSAVAPGNSAVDQRRVESARCALRH